MTFVVLVVVVVVVVVVTPTQHYSNNRLVLWPFLQTASEQSAVLDFMWLHLVLKPTDWHAGRQQSINVTLKLSRYVNGNSPKILYQISFLSQSSHLTGRPVFCTSEWLRRPSVKRQCVEWDIKPYYTMPHPITQASTTTYSLYTPVLLIYPWLYLTASEIFVIITL